MAHKTFFQMLDETTQRRLFTEPSFRPHYAEPQYLSWVIANTTVNRPKAPIPKAYQAQRRSNGPQKPTPKFELGAPKSWRSIDLLEDFQRALFQEINQLAERFDQPQISRIFCDSDVKKLYRTLLKRLHPDTNGQSAPEMIAKVVEVFRKFLGSLNEEKARNSAENQL